MSVLSMCWAAPATADSRLFDDDKRTDEPAISLEPLLRADDAADDEEEVEEEEQHEEEEVPEEEDRDECDDDDEDDDAEGEDAACRGDCTREDGTLLLLLK
jgi:hypothetical protein